MFTKRRGFVSSTVVNLHRNAFEVTSELHKIIGAVTQPVNRSRLSGVGASVALVWPPATSSDRTNAAREGHCTGAAQAQKALRESEERYRGIVETANEGIWTMNFDSTITFVNQRLANMLGYSTAEIVGKSLYDFIPAEYCERAGVLLKRASLNTAQEESEGAIRQRSGEITWVFIKTNCIHDAAGATIGMLAMITDATPKMAADRALRSSEAEYRQIVESTTDGIIKIDRAGRIVFVNARLAEIVGYTPAELVGAALLTIVAPSQHAAVQQSLKDREKGRIAAFDTFYRHKSGAEIAVSIAGAPLHDEFGTLIGVLGVVRAVTERKKLQAQLIVSDRMASVGTLAAGVAHEINNPLSAVIANLEFVDEGVARFEIRHRVELVKFLGTVPDVNVNEARLGQVFLNLIVNAAQSIPVGQQGRHEIHIETYQSDSSVIIEIGDTGCGMSPETIERIFDAFYTTKTVGAGTGLGLAICQRIVTDMGGLLTVTSALGAGSTFRVSIPITDEARTETAASPLAELRHSGGRILVVDDEDTIGRVALRSLGDDYDILVATRAWAALALIESGQTFDLILCDLMMPSLTGIDLYKTLLAEAPAQAPRMLFMSGGAFTEEARHFTANNDVSTSKSRLISRPCARTGTSFSRMRAR